MIQPSECLQKNYAFFIGVDISKNELDYAVMKESVLLFHLEGKNTAIEIQAFLTNLITLEGLTLGNALFCMESTGFYADHLLNILSELGAHIVVTDPLRIKKSSGIVRGKNDKIDAIKIAKFACKNANDLRLWLPKRFVIQQLKGLLIMRARLLNIALILRTPLKEQKEFVKIPLQHQDLMTCKKSVAALKSDLQNVDRLIKKTVFSDKRLSRLNELITSITGIGLVTSAHIIVYSNEFIDFKEAKKFACYAGVVPFPTESGTSKHPARVSRFANIKMKTALYLPAITASCHDPELKAYFEKKTKIEGKHKMAVYNAIKNKLLLRVFSCVSQDRHFIKKGFIAEQKAAPS